MQDLSALDDDSDFNRTFGVVGTCTETLDEVGGLLFVLYCSSSVACDFFFKYCKTLDAIFEVRKAGRLRIR